MALTGPPAVVQVEVDLLLASIPDSGCESLRSGNWHDAKAATAHLREKFDYLAARDQIARTEDFIEAFATQSSLSGSPCAVKCA